MFHFFENLVDPFDNRPIADPPPKSVWAFLLENCRSFNMVLVALFFATLITATLEVLFLVGIGKFMDYIQSQTDIILDNLWGVVIAFGVFLILLRPLASMIDTMIADQSIDVNLTQAVRWRAFRRVIQKSVGWFEKDLAGRIANRAINTPNSVKRLALMTLSDSAHGLILVLGTFIVLSQMNIYMTVPLLIWVTLYVALTRWTISKVEPLSNAASEAKSTVSGVIIDSLTNIHTVKSAGSEQAEINFVKQSLITLRKRALERSAITTKMEIGLHMLNGALLFAVIGGGTVLWASGGITAGELIGATLLILRIETISKWFIRLAGDIFAEIGTIREGMKSISQPVDLRDHHDARTLEVTGGALVISGLTHHYGKAIGGLNDVSFSIKGGEKVAIVGRSGAGKSTLLKLFLRFCEAEGGSIAIDGQDIRTLTQNSLRRHIGLVQQDSGLLHRSVRDNIAYGRPYASEQEIIAAAKKAKAHDFISGLEDGENRIGYDAHVGERGIKLSGGQRQRIALARLILKNAPILFLDEATSALDSEVEAAIQSSLGDLMEDKTVIAIARRLSTIAHMDRILVMDEGRIVEDGTHDRLLAMGGLYAGFWQRQSGGFLDVDAA
jgi:ATP-binding cassette subfamily B multidrug efflux pump